MSKRYEGEISLRLRGDKVECQKYILRARSVLGEVWQRDIVLGELPESHRTVILDQRAIVDVYATIYVDPIVTITVAGDEDEKELPPVISRTVWVPKGIQLTPVTVEDPDGWGLPRRDSITGTRLEGLGTRGGDMPQIIINKLANNNYLDKWEFISGYDGIQLLGANNRIREEGIEEFGSSDNYAVGGSLQYQFWHPLYQPLDCENNFKDTEEEVPFWEGDTTQIPGLYNGEALLQAQFDYLLGPALLFEAPSEEWHTHRAEEVLYYVIGQESNYRAVNSVRAGAGLDELLRPLRGHASPAILAVTEVALSGLQFHDNEDFRPGFRSIPSRLGACQSAAVGAENLLITPGGPGTAEGGIAANERWEESPDHYDVMVHEIWDDDSVGTELFIDTAGATIIESESLGELDPPISGVEWAQVYVASETWLPAGWQYHEGEHHLISHYGKMSRNDRGGYYTDPSYFFVIWGQITLAVPQDLLLEPAFALLSAATYEKDGITHLRAVLACGDQGLDKVDHDWADLDDFTLVVITSEINSTGESLVGELGVTGGCRWEVEDEFLFELEDWIATPPGNVAFAPNGEKFVFTMHQWGDTDEEDYYLTSWSIPHAPVAGIPDTAEPDYYRVEYDALADLTQVASRWALTKIIMPRVTIASSETLDEFDEIETSSFFRGLHGSFPCMFDYDDDNNLISLTCTVDESTSITYPGFASNSRERKFTFPSGKQIKYMDETFLDHVCTDSFFLVFYDINVRTEDCVFVRRTLETFEYTTQAALDNLFPDKRFLGYKGEYTLEVDLSHGPNHHTEVMWDQGEGVCAAIFNTNGIGTEAVTHDFHQPRYTYQNGTTPAVYNVGGYPAICPTSYPDINNLGVVAGGTNGSDRIQVGYVNSIRLTGHQGIYLPGLTSRGDDTLDPADFSKFYHAGNYAFFGGPEYINRGVSTHQASMAPAFIPEPDSATCQIVRHEDRVVVRVESFTLPYSNLDVTYSEGEHNGMVIIDEINVNWHLVPEEARVIIYSNFDIDVAAGMSDVTDIAPFGRVG